MQAKRLFITITILFSLLLPAPSRTRGKGPKVVKCLGCILLTVLTIFFTTRGTSYGADLNVGEPRTVRMIYFLPNDRPFRADVVQKMKDDIRAVQTFYAEQMQAHGYGNKTFHFETTHQDQPNIHRVNGKHPFSYYDNTLGTAVVGELEQAFDLDANIYFIVLGAEALRQGNGLPALGVGAARGKNGGHLVVPNGFEWDTVAHELGHTFGLGHDFRDDSYIMSYGSRRDVSLSACAAEFLSSHPYFNSHISIAKAPPPTIELISVPTYPVGSESIPVRLKVKDSEGIHQVQLFAWGGLQDCRGLAGKQEAVVEFAYDGGISLLDFDTAHVDFVSLSDATVHNIWVKAIDTDGNVGTELFKLAQISPHHITTLVGHTEGVRSLAFSPDGQTLASVSFDKMVKLWNIATGTNIATFKHTRRVKAVTFSPDGATLASGGNDGIKLWDLTTGRNIVTLLHGDFVNALSFSPDGTTLASGGDDWTVKLWDLTTGHNIATMRHEGDQGFVRSLSFSPDGTTLASGSWDGEVKLWDVAKRRNINTLRAGSPVDALSFSPDGTTLAFGSWTGEVKLWDVAERRNIDTLRAGSPVDALSFSPDGTTLAAGGWTGEVKLWNIATGFQIAAFPHTSAVWSVAFSPDTKTFASGTFDGAVELWNVLDAGDESQRLAAEYQRPVTISDANLRTKIVETLNKPVDVQLTGVDMLRLTRLEARNANIQHLTGLEHAHNLRELHLGGEDIDGGMVNSNAISDFTALKTLTNLRTLDLSDCSLSDISVLSGLTRLSNLNISGTSVSDISVLSDLTRLTLLDLSNTAISDVSALEGLTQLTGLYLDNTSVSDVSPLAGLTRLTHLYLQWNAITDISALSGLTRLNFLDLSDNEISDISVLSGLTQLAYLDLSNNAILDVSPLIGLELLETQWDGPRLYIGRNPLSYTSINTHIPAMQAKGVEVRFGSRTPTRLVKISGTAQQGIVNTVLPLPFVVEVRDERNQAFAGVPVTFTVTSGDGKLSVTTVPTDAAGRASAHLTLGRAAGTTTVRVAAAEISRSEEFTATGVLLSAPVVVSDAALYTAIVSALGKSPNSNLTVSDMLKLTTLTADNMDILELTGLEQASNLTTVSLNSNNLSDIAPLAGLSKLTTLSLNNNRISNVTPLAVLAELQTLSLENNNLTDVVPLSGLMQLETLSLDNNRLSDISSLAELSQLEVLSINNNHLWNVAPLLSLMKLKTLQLKGNLLSYPSLHTHIPAIQAGGATVVVDLRTPTVLVRVSGTHGVAGTAIPVSVEVQDAQGLGFAGVPVTFAVTAGGGHLSASNAITDMTGSARTTLTLGTTPGKNIVSAAAVEVRQPVIFTITAINVNSPVTIPDANLRAKIAEALSKPVGVQLTAGDMLTLTELNAPNANIRNLTGLEHAHNLRVLNLKGEYIEGEGTVNSNTIPDFSPIVGLTELTELDFSFGSVSDVSFLSGLTQLRTLRLFNNPLSDISALSGLTQLTFLELSSTAISDVSPLAGLTQLTRLYLFNTSISNLSALSGLTALTELGISGTTVSDVSPLAGLTRLTHLYLVWNAISDISVLSGLTQLYSLQLSGNEISDISPLSDLTQLAVLALSNNAILDVSPLIGLELSGTQWDSTGLYIESNPLNYASVHTHIPAMQAKGVEVRFDNRAHSALVKISGDTQEGEAGTTLASPFVVEALDEHGVPITELSVTFRVIEGNGSLRPTSTITDTNGRAQTTLTLGGDPGVIKIRVTVSQITYPVTFTAIATAASRLATDVNGDGIVNIQDLVLVSSNLGQTGKSNADVNGDGVVNIQDLVRVAGALGDGAAAAPSLHASDLEGLTAADIQELLTQARQLALTDPAYLRGIAVLEQLLAHLLPKETALLANYPNPFNPETWLPYTLAKPTEVTLHIYAVNGALVRVLALGHQSAGKYQSRSRAAYWDGRNSLGEAVASGVYFYTLTAGDFTATRRMLIRK